MLKICSRPEIRTRKSLGRDVLACFPYTASDTSSRRDVASRTGQRTASIRPCTGAGARYVPFVLVVSSPRISRWGCIGWMDGLMGARDVFSIGFVCSDWSLWMNFSESVWIEVRCFFYCCTMWGCVVWMYRVFNFVILMCVKIISGKLTYVKNTISIDYV